MYLFVGGKVHPLQKESEKFSELFHFCVLSLHLPPTHACSLLCFPPLKKFNSGVPPNLVVANLVVCNFYFCFPLLRPFALFCALAIALFCAHWRSFALICVCLRPTAFRTTAFGNSRLTDSVFAVFPEESQHFFPSQETRLGNQNFGHSAE